MKKLIVTFALVWACSVDAQPLQTQTFIPIDQQEWEALKRDLAELPISAKGFQMVITLMEQHQRQAIERARNANAEAAIERARNAAAKAKSADPSLPLDK